MREYEQITIVTEGEVYATVGPVPPGYEVVDFRPPRAGELYHNTLTGEVTECGASFDKLPRRILEKVPEKPPVHVVTFRSLGRPPKMGEYYQALNASGEMYVRNSFNDSYYDKCEGYARTESTQ